MAARISITIGCVLGLLACGGEIRDEGRAEPTPPTPSPTTPAPTATPSPAPSVPVSPTPTPEPTSCPTTAASIGGATSILSTVALGAATYHLASTNPRQDDRELLEGTWSGSKHAVANRVAIEARFQEAEALGADTWAATEGFSDAFSRKVVAYKGLGRLGSFEVRNTNLDRTFMKEGLSPSYDVVVYQDGASVARATVGLGKDDWHRTASPLCVADCELLWAKGEDVLMVKHAAGAPSVLVRMAYTSLGTAAATVPDPTAGREVVAVTKNRIFLDGAYDDRVPLVLDRATLAEVPFEWDGVDDIKAVRERPDGTFDVFSVYSGEIASAKLASATGTILAEDTGHAAYGTTTAGSCGFWVDGRLLPYAAVGRR